MKNDTLFKQCGITFISKIIHTYFLQTADEKLAARSFFYLINAVYFWLHIPWRTRRLQTITSLFRTLIILFIKVYSISCHNKTSLCNWHQARSTRQVDICCLKGRSTASVISRVVICFGWKWTATARSSLTHQTMICQAMYSIVRGLSLGHSCI